MPRNKSVEAAGVGACEENDPARQSTQALAASGTEICTPGQHQTKEWLSRLFFRGCFIAGDAATESSGSSVASTAWVSETATVRGPRITACRPSIGVANKQQIPDLACTVCLSVRSLRRSPSQRPPSTPTAPQRRQVRGWRSSAPSSENLSCIEEVFRAYLMTDAAAGRRKNEM